MKKSTFLIESTKNKSMGTGFCIAKDNNGSFILTCMHVIEECKKDESSVEDSFQVDGKKAKLLYGGSSEEIDLAVIYVKGLINSEVLELCSSEVKEGLLFDINGYQPFESKSHKYEEIKGKIKKKSSIQVNNKSINTYELSIDKGDYIRKGFSGAAVLLKGTNKVIAVVTNKDRDENYAYAIPISYLSIIWKDKVTFLECENEMSFFNKKKNSFIEKIKEQLSIIVKSVIVAVSITLLTNYLTNIINGKKVSNGSIPRDVPICSDFNQSKIEINKDKKYVVIINSQEFIFKDKKNANNLIKFSIDNKVNFCTIPNSSPTFNYIQFTDSVVKKITLDSHPYNLNNKNLQIREKDKQWKLYSGNILISSFGFEDYAEKAKKLIKDNNLSKISSLENFSYIY